ncbi:MAG TPA: hypothetical protein VMF11_00095 [Candidatus Baltobacteraceae bacterium]|nr:hypothetical protein [Candidatus Baltobacteraceae bacterium]
MLVALLLSTVVAFPADGTYTYHLQTPTAQFTSAIVITSAPGGGTITHEAFSGSGLEATTDQRFDAQLHPVSYSGGNIGRPLVTITFSAASAVYDFDGHSGSVALDDSACVLVEDNVLTFSVMLPAVLRATGATQCILLLTAPRALAATVSDASPPVRPPSVPGGDASATIHFGAVTETIWYDPRTLIPDYLDFGAGATATLTARSTSTVLPAALPSP